jgi:DNA invertase Pin-like site-specific DNA recombinase
MQLVAYLRVSTDRQAEAVLGLEVQEEAIRVNTARHDHELVAVTRDEGVSGTKPAAERPGLTEALNLIKEGGAEGLEVARLDRLARTLIVQEAVLGNVWMHEGRVFSADHGEVLEDDPDNPMRTAMRQMMGVFAQLERGMITRDHRPAHL